MSPSSPNPYPVDSFASVSFFPDELPFSPSSFLKSTPHVYTICYRRPMLLHPLPPPHCKATSPSSTPLCNPSLGLRSYHCCKLDVSSATVTTASTRGGLVSWQGEAVMAACDKPVSAAASGHELPAIHCKAASDFFAKGIAGAARLLAGGSVRYSWILRGRSSETPGYGGGVQVL